jgi:hypothetical protein
VNVTVDTLAASYSAETPTIWGAGQFQHYSITLTNKGTATWHASGPDRVRLGVYFGGKSDVPPSGKSAPQMVALPGDVARGESVTLEIDVVAPTKSGSYVLRQRLIQDQFGWFSNLLSTNVSVQKLSALYMVSPPTQWQAGETKTYTITLLNNGSSTWNATGPNAVHLGVYFGGASDAVGAWSEEPMRFALPKDVGPGKKITLTISVQAPLAPGHYVLRHRMVKETVNWFDPMQRTNVSVA